ncbi:MAG: peptidoglycan-binding domain-containing protein [Acidimicrobiia bacterium]
MATEMQRIVKGAGWYSGAIDGIIGPVTDGAIKNYQNAHGLTADGIVGPATWNALWVDTAYCQFGNPYDYLRAKGYENCTSLGSIRHASSSTFYFYVKKLNNTWHASMNRSGPS